MTRTSYAGLLAALVLLLAGCRGADPSPAAAPTPTEPATTVAWWAQGALHVDGSVVATHKPLQIRYAGGTTAVRHHRRWALVVDGHLEHLPASVNDLVISPDGRFVAWVVGHTLRQLGEFRFLDTSRVVRRDMRTGEVDRSARWRGEVECCDAVGVAMLARVSNAGIVTGYAHFRGRAWTWHPGHARLALRGVTGRQLSMHTRTTDGHHVDVGWLPLEGGDWRVMGWESPTTVVLARATVSGEPRVHEVARCERRTHTCATVPGEPHGYAVLPDRVS